MEIEAKMKDDWIRPYAEQGGKIPVVTKSNHPRFSIGTRLDWGFVQVAIKDGYTVTIEPHEVNRSNCDHPEGFRRTCIIKGFNPEERQYTCKICGANKYIIKRDKSPEELPTDANWNSED